MKSITISLITAFFIGRICFFGGTFPGAIALITVMMAVSTIYLYFVPVLLAAMLTYTGQGLLIQGDFLAIIMLGIFFAFFHQQRFSIGQRTMIAIMVTLFAHCVYACGRDILYLLQPEVLLKEAFAIMIYIRVWNLLAKLLYMGPEALKISREKVELAIEIFIVSVIGSINQMEVVFSLWCLVIVAILLQWGMQSAFTMAALCGVFWACQGELEWEIFPLLFGGILVGWYGAMLVEGRYRKTVIATAVFLSVGLQGGVYHSFQVYGIAIVMMLFILMPYTMITKGFCLLEERLMPEFSTERDLQSLKLRKDLLKKREAFSALGHLYSKDYVGKEIISYQFMGMARTLDSLLKDMSRKAVEAEKGQPYMRVSTAQASYACEEVSGDSMKAFALSPYHVALMISDGMGKGRQAAEESTFVVETLSRLLQAGFDVDLAMKTVNGILMTGNQDDRFATVDLTIVDRRQGRAKIFKMGAATTFMKHDGKVSMLKQQALPAGITEGLQLEYMDIKLKRGDILVMVSDGITDCDRKDPNCDWLRERLLEIHSKDPETVAELILNKAAEKYGIRERDDLSVLVATMEI